ncbi:hypothetical protein AVEN_12213-1 [Araneus ventricosus]|uniref:Paired domain-containing protein n=1 Tax=Araneus ventricosus TaxID=182803 RepID=A0A4Y2HYI7_ARAVE|nr:hypothetical protein AVEN_12213-1 [Araneus ventricosus]
MSERKRCKYQAFVISCVSFVDFHLLLAVSLTIASSLAMSRKSRLPDSLRWRAVGWMEMGLSQADAARRLNVSRSVVQRLWDQYQSEDSVSRRHVSGRPRVTTPAEDSFLVSGPKEKKHY